MAGGATTFDMRPFVLELHQQRLGPVRPDLAEGALPDVSEGDPPPELVGVDFPVPTDAADPVAGAVSLVHPEKLQDLRRALRVFSPQAQINVGAVGVVVHGEDLLLQTPVEQIPGPVHDQVKQLPRSVVRKILPDQLRSASGVNQVVETAARDVLGFEKVEDRRNVRRVVPVDREAHADLDPQIPADPDPPHRRCEGPGHPPEAVMRRLGAVQAHADVGEADLPEDPGLPFADQRSVRRDDRPHPALHGKPRQLRQVGPHQRLAARKQKDRRAEARQIRDHRFRLFGRQFIRIKAILGTRVAVDAFQVAPPSHVPDDNRLLVLRELEQVGREAGRLPPVPENVPRFHRAAV